MAFNVQAPVAEYVAAGYVRITQFAERIAFLLESYQPVDQMVNAIIDLRQKLEAVARTTDAAELATLLGDLGETYGIPESVYTDPLLRPVLTVPINGAEVRPLVLGIQDGKVLGIQGGKVLALSYRLVAVAGPPVFNRTLTPTDPTEGAVTFTGDLGDSFEFNAPMMATTGGPQQMFLFVAGVTQQAAGIDFPMDAVGEYFRLNYRGVAYLGTFQIVAGNRVDLLPE